MSETQQEGQTDSSNSEQPEAYQDEREIFALKQQISDVVWECWDEHEYPLLLPRLGLIVFNGQEQSEQAEQVLISEVAKKHANTLTDFIDTYLKELSIVHHSQKTILVGVMPETLWSEFSTERLDEVLDTATYEDSGGASTGESPNPDSNTRKVPKKYISAFWSAFQIGLKEGHTRWFQIETLPFFFEDVEEGSDQELEKSQNNIRWIGINRQFVADKDIIRTNPTLIWENIIEWCRVTGTDEELFVVPGKKRFGDSYTPETQKRISRKTKKELGQNIYPRGSLAWKLCNELSWDQFKRVLIPLDVMRVLTMPPTTPKKFEH